jgi:hypothetical protein
MKTVASFGILTLCLTSLWAAEPPLHTSSEAEERERLFQRLVGEILAEMRETETFTNQALSASNLDNPLIRQVFSQMIVHPSFGLRWDETPAPTVRDKNAMAAVEAFIATNGWSMHTGSFVPGYGLGLERAGTIRGLPWEVIRDRDFKAVTHEGILFVILAPAGHDSCRGVAYNPRTNSFPPTINGFKPLGQHWYAWIQHEDPVMALREYEGQRLGEPSGPASRSEPVGSETNRASAATGSGR